MTTNLARSGYLLRRPARTAPAWLCYYCGCQTSELVHAAQHAKTRDHILARATGRMRCSQATNIRPCCLRCNALRAKLGHCCGALMLALLEATHRRKDCAETAILLGMKSLGRRARRKQEKQRRFDHAFAARSA